MKWLIIEFVVGQIRSLLLGVYFCDSKLTDSVLQIIEYLFSGGNLVVSHCGAHVGKRVGRVNEKQHVFAKTFALIYFRDKVNFSCPLYSGKCNNNCLENRIRCFEYFLSHLVISTCHK